MTVKELFDRAYRTQIGPQNRGEFWTPRSFIFAETSNASTRIQTIRETEILYDRLDSEAFHEDGKHDYPKTSDPVTENFVEPETTKSAPLLWPVRVMDNGSRINNASTRTVKASTIEQRRRLRDA